MIEQQMITTPIRRFLADRKPAWRGAGSLSLHLQKAAPRMLPVLAFLLLLLIDAGEAGAARQAGPPALAEDGIIFDGYRWGVHSLEFKVEGKRYAVRQKDLAKNVWGSWHSRSADQVAGNKAFQFTGSVSHFPEHFAALSQVSWKASNVVGVPYQDALFRRARPLREVAGGREVRAYYWAEANSNEEAMDLVIGPDNEILAAIDPTNDQVLVRRGYENFTTIKHWRDPSVSQPRYGYKSLKLEMMPTRAGPRLATLVYLPDGDVQPPYPTILVRTPYGISHSFEKTYLQYPIRGYAVVIQAAQGTIHWDPQARSEGAHQEMVNEPGDGADALEWIVSQPWSNGSICTQGTSYLGFTQWAASMARNPALKCMIPESSMGTGFSDQPYMGGTFVQGFAYYILRMLDKKLLPDRTWSQVFRHRPIADIDQFATGEDIPLWNRIIEHASNDGYWKRQDWYAGNHARDFGTLQISGWFDDDFPGTRSNWALTSKYGTRPNRLILGPWRHGYNVDRILNGYDYGADAVRSDIWLIKQKWYDSYLKAAGHDVARPEVEYFMLGANEWRRADAWPPRQAIATPFYLHSTGSANRNSDDGKLDGLAPSRLEQSDAFVFDPKNAVKNWYNFDLMKEWSDYQSYPYDFRDIETRSDVATYTTPPLDRDLSIAGDVRVVLYASTDVRDTDWWAYISDVAPDNSSNRLSLGVIRARFRGLDDPNTHIFGSNFERQSLLSGNIKDVVRYEISLRSIANTFKKGHRVRIALMNANDNYSFPNSNTGNHEGYSVETVPARIRIHHGPDHPSHVILPVLGLQNSGRAPDAAATDQSVSRGGLKR